MRAISGRFESYFAVEQSAEIGSDADSGGRKRSDSCYSDDQTAEALSEWERSSLWDKWTFSVANPMLQRGAERPLEFDDLLHTRSKDHARVLLKKLKRVYGRSSSFGILPRLLVALFKVSWWDCLVVSSFTVLEGSTRVSMPIVLIYFIRSLQNENAPQSQAFMLAGILGLIGFAQTIIHHVLFFESMKLGWNWKTATTAYIFDTTHLVKESVLQQNDIGTGKLVNLLSNDVQRFEEFSIFGAFLWEAVLEAIGILVVLIFVLGAPSAIAGVASTACCIPVMVYLSKLFAGYRGKTAAATDARVRHIGEIISGIASVKSYSWEDPMFSLVKQLRDKETSQIRGSQNLRSVNLGFSYCLPTIVSLITFGTYWALGNELTLPIVYATMSLLQALRLALGRMWTRSIETSSEAVASCVRIEQYLDLVTASEAASAASDALSSTSVPTKECSVHSSAIETSPPDAHGIELVPSSSCPTGTTEAASTSLLTISKSSYRYGGNETKAVLTDIELSVSPGELLVVIGSVGAGKSSLLSAILKELIEVHGAHASSDINSSCSSVKIRPHTRIAYCNQRPWILASSVKSNIALAGPLKNERDPTHKFKSPPIENPSTYKLAVDSCLLSDDMSRWPGGDDTEVGERGISISGGQKARIALARAVYSDADLYLLDDPLSAVDAHVGHALFFNCIDGALRRRNKAVVLVTHQLQYLKYADKVLVLDAGGTQLFCGSPVELIQCEAEAVQQLLEENTNHATGSAEHFTDMAPSPNESVNKTNAVSTPERTANDSQISKREIIEKEDKIDGGISLYVYWRYICWGGRVLGVYVVILIVVSQMSSMIADYWLRWWATESFGSQSRPFYLIWLGVLTAFCVFIGFYRAFKWFDFTLEASSNLHESALQAVLRSPLQFFISNPTGRILNRFSKDTNLGDELLPVTLFLFLESMIYCVASIVLVCISLPWLCLLIPVLAVSFHWLRAHYIKSARELKRIEAVTRSPIYSDFAATLDGLSTIRAYKLQQRVSKLFFQQIDENGRAFYSFVLAARWLGFRLDCETAVILVAVSFLSAGLKSTIDVGLIGFTLVYSMSLSGLFQWAVRLSVEVETQMTAIERIHSYAGLPPEDGYEQREHRTASIAKEPMTNIEPAVLSSTPDSASNLELETKTSSITKQNSVGNLEIREMSVKYRADLDPVLKDISLDIPAGSKVGICGRTGSGKSSLLLALLRLNIVTEGDILVDGQSILTMPLEQARGLFSVIPQEPVLFSGSLRFNLDPFSMFTDTEIWSALKDAQIYNYVSALGSSNSSGGTGRGLEYLVEEGGKNFSTGQRQLLSLCRAILRKSTVVLMDEVTASVDFATDRLIQATLRTSPVLSSSTIVTVAHRLRTIADSDIIVVISDGEVAESGAPVQLLRQKDSLFRQLAEESNEFGDIERIAQGRERGDEEVGSSQ